MDWDEIRYFLAVAREGTSTAAGARLGVNHTTVSRRISALEEELGTRLFDRTREGYLMTQAAEELLAEATQMEEHAQALFRKTQGREAALAGNVRLTVPYDFANVVLVPVLDQFQLTFPEIDLELLTTVGLVDLAAREADVALRLTRKPPDHLVGRRVLPLCHGLYASASSVQCRRAPELILPREGNSMPEWVEQNFPDARVRLRVDSLSTTVAAVRQGLGLARLPCYLGDSDPDLRRLDVRLEPSAWGIWVLSHADLRTTARVRACREFLTETILCRKDFLLGHTSRYA